MAKKDPKDMTVEEKLEHLYQLQTTLSAIDEKKTLRGELPLEVQDLEDAIKGLETRMENIQKEISEIEKAITDRKGEMETAKIYIKRYSDQLQEVSNNREWDTLDREIKEKQADVDLCDKKIKEAVVKVEEKKKALEETRALVDDRNKDLVVKREELDEIMQETREEEEKLKEKAHELEQKIDPRILFSFKRIRKNARNGLGIVYVQRDACGGCFNKIPPQRQLDIKMHKKIIVCEYCGRIMIDPELAGVKIEAPAEEKGKKKGTRKTAKKSTKKEEPAAE
jgi:predicted  nucleic acid-binding Zn-ribbon protein